MQSNIRFFSSTTYSISIVGMGGVGGYYGGKLAHAYANSSQYIVSFVARGEHFQKIKINGLMIKTKNQNLQVRPHLIVEEAKNLPPQDLIILATKSYHLTEDFFNSLKTIVHSKSIIMPLLNGMNNRSILEKYFLPTQIIDACVYISSHISQPGEITHLGGSGELVFGSNSVSPRELSNIQSIFENAGITSRISENINLVLWEKYLFVSPMSLMIVAYNCDKKSILEDNILFNELIELMREVIAVAIRKNIFLPENILENSIDKLKKSASTVPSMKLDYDNNKPLELNIFSGYIIEQAELHKMDAPYHRALNERIIALIERNGLKL